MPWTAALDNSGTPPHTAPTTAANDGPAPTTPSPAATAGTAGSGGSGDQHQGPHFQACIVCQRPGSDCGGAAAAAAAAADGTAADGITAADATPPAVIRTRGAAGPLLRCTTCPASFHLSCLRPRLRAMPAAGAKWSCAYCHAMGRVVGGDSDGACGAVRLMESLRQGMLGAVQVRACFVLLVVFARCGEFGGWVACVCVCVCLYGCCGGFPMAD